MEHCPNCKRKDFGIIAEKQFFCWNCFIEITIDKQNKIHLFQVEADGSLTSLNDLFLDDIEKIENIS